MQGSQSLRVAALALALAAGCGGEGRNDLPGTLVTGFDQKREELERSKRFRLYFLGTSFDGFALTRIGYDRDPWRPVSFIYGDCEVGAFADGGCAPPVEVQVTAACPRNLHGVRVPREGPTIRGARAGSLGSELTLYTGNVAVTIFGKGRRRAADALRPIGADRPPARLPAPTQAALRGRVQCRG